MKLQYVSTKACDGKNIVSYHSQCVVLSVWVHWGFSVCKTHGGGCAVYMQYYLVIVVVMCVCVYAYVCAGLHIRMCACARHTTGW